MKLINRFYLSFLVLLLQFFQLTADKISIHVETVSDYEILNKFFRMGILEEGDGYVLEGDKPISIRTLHSLTSFPIGKDLESTEEGIACILLFREAIPIWKKLCSSQANFILKAVPVDPYASVDSDWEVQFINVSKLQRVIEENIDLFRYVLNPTIQPQELVNRIAYSNETLTDILLDNRVLEGIVLGFGSHNSLCGGHCQRLFFPDDHSQAALL